MIKDLIKFMGNKIIIFLLLIITISSCKQFNKDEDYAVIEYGQVYQNGICNINVYLLAEYNPNKSLKENLLKNSKNEIECLVFYMSIDDFKELDINQNYSLGTISVNIHDFDNVEKKYAVVYMDGIKIRCNYYSIYCDYDSLLIKLNDEKLNNIE